MLAKVMIALVSAVGGYLAIALALTLSQRPSAPAAKEGAGIAFQEAISSGLNGLPDPLSYTARDGTALTYRRYDSAARGDTLIVLVHGSGWHGMQFHRMASEIAARGLGSVVVPDLRGHGRSPERRGDVDYIGQFEDDLADLIGHARGQASRVVLGGHSSGGGLVVRFAGGAHGGMADAFVLLAPFLKYNAPPTQENSGGWAYPATRRIIGLTMLNAVGVTALNHLPVIGFAMPRMVVDGPLGRTATTAYSFRLNTSFAPRSDYGADLAKIDRPLLVVAGTNDEAFRAELYEPTISAHTTAGSYVILDGVTHMGVVFGDAAIEAVAGWIQRLPAR